MLSDFFQLTAIPADQIQGTYSLRLVLLSYIVATGASYVALDIANRVRDVSVSNYSNLWWILGGSLAMGAGIWSMHFIGMLAFIMPMPMAYAPFLTGLSMFIAILSSGIAFFLLRNKTIKLHLLILGGIILGLSIATMHYVGMAAMLGMKIHYLPGLFFLSILIAIIASEAALYLAIKSTEVTSKVRTPLKIGSAFIMGAAICGMHYTGMAAAVFSPEKNHVHIATPINPDLLAIIIAIVTIFILTIAVALSSFQALLNARSVDIARKVGMAEVASNVLHNVGNVLNSVNVSASLIMERLKNVNLENLNDLNQLLSHHEHDLGQFMTEDPKGSKIPILLKKMAEYWHSEFELAKKELDQLAQNIQHIKNIISTQQKLSGVTSIVELICIETMIEESLAIVNINFKRHHIHVHKSFAKLKHVYIDKSKLTQILINLIENAKESLLASEKPDKKMTISTGILNDNQFFIEVTDNGLGIPLKNHTKIFSHGFTTKKTGHGFGLHASAIAANEMQGRITIHSEGEGKGAIFRLIFPYKIGQDFSLETKRANYDQEIKQNIIGG